MKINKDKSNKRQNKKTKSETKTLMSRSVPYLVLCVLTIILVAIVQYYLVVVQPAEDRNRTFVNVTMTSYVELVLSRLDSIRLAARSVLNDPAAKSILRKASELDLKKFELNLKQRLDNVIGVRILNSDVHNVDANSVPAISNVTLQLIRQLKAQKTVIHEAINTGTESQHIAILFPIVGTSKVALIGVDFKIFNEVLPEHRLVPGYYEFWQSFANQNRTIISLGNKQYRQAEPLGVASVAETQWKIAYWPADPAKFNYEIELLFFFGGLILVLLLVGVGGFIGLRNLDKMVRSDATNFIKWLLDKQKGQAIIVMPEYDIQVYDDMSKALERESFKFQSYATHSAKNNPNVMANNPRIGSASSHAGSALAVGHTNQSKRANIQRSIFREYDIRGIAGDSLTSNVVRLIGQAIGSEAFERGEQRIAIARDGRLSGSELIKALKQGLIDSGRDVIDIGEVPTPVLYFATHFLSASSGVMLTGSHNPKNYNGLKIVIGGHTLSGKEIQGLYERIETGNMVKGIGSHKSNNIVQDYISRITDDVVLSQPLKIAIDCGNGIAGKIAPQLFQALGCEVIGLYCDVDGNFPNHHPDPSKPENLAELRKLVMSENADVGLAFDGDGDRLGVIDSDGNIIWPDRQMMLYAADVLSRNPGTDIIYDVKCSKHLAEVISSNGGHPIMWKTGHSLVKAKMRETGAMLGGECSGHIFFKERWYGFDDALYTAARLLEIVANDTRKSAEIFKAFPNSEVTPEINIKIADDRKFNFIHKLEQQGAFGEGKVINIDGIRVEYADGWGLVRASNTSPCLVVRFEGKNKQVIERIKKIFRQQILMVDSSLNLDF